MASDEKEKHYIPPEETPKDNGYSMWWILVIVGIIIALIFIFFFWFRRTKTSNDILVQVNDERNALPLARDSQLPPNLPLINPELPVEVSPAQYLQHPVTPGTVESNPIVNPGQNPDIMNRATTLGSTNLGSTTLGSTNLGSTTLESTTLGNTTLGSTTGFNQNSNHINGVGNMNGVYSTMTPTNNNQIPIQAYYMPSVEMNWNS